MGWRIVAAACLLFLFGEWINRPRPPRYPVTITMSDRRYARDSLLGTAYIEFRSTNRPRGGSSPWCRETPEFRVERDSAKTWVAMQTVARPCVALQADASADQSVTWHTRIGSPGRYRIMLMYRPFSVVHMIAGPTFEVR